MKEFDARAARADDAAAVADLINAVGAAGGGPGGFSPAAIEEVMTNEVKDLATDTRVITDADGRLVGVALVALPPDGGDRVELIGGVHPDRRGAGIGRELLAWQLDRAALRHAEAPAAHWLAQVVAGVGDTTAIRLYERFGFTVARYFLAMTAPTTPPPARPPAEGVRIERYEQERVHDVYEVHRAAFSELWGNQDRTFEEWAALTVRSATFRSELARVAVAGDAIVGYVLPYDTGVPERLYIGQIGTASSWRRRGVAAALLADVLGAAARAGYTHAALDTDADNPTGAAGVYAKVGFVVDQRVVAYRKPV